MASGNRYLIVSDLHLCDVEEHPDGWKAYKGSRFVFDDEFAALVDRFAAAGPPDAPRTLVLNGDIVDFDLVTAVPDAPPWPVGPSERRRGLDATAEKSEWKLGRVLPHHPVFLAALARFLVAGHRVVLVMGNHDREFHFPEVQQAFENAIRRVADERGQTFPAEGALRFEPWFYYVPGELYAEHGQQYDHYSSFRNVLAPTIRIGGREHLALPMGNLSNRFLMSRMGFFNPHASEFIMTLHAYAAHWFRHYALSRHSIVVPWFIGSLVVIGKLLKVKGYQRLPHPDADPQRRAVAARFGLDLDVVERLGELQRPPITTKFYRIIREFWIDRLLMAIGMTGGTIALALVPIPLWIKLMVPLTCFPLLYFIYERLVRGEDIFTTEKHQATYARRIARLLPVRLIAFGHTHKPKLLALDRGVTFVDTGTWAPIPSSAPPDRLAPGYRNYVVASFDDGTPTVWFDCLT